MIVFFLNSFIFFCCANIPVRSNAIKITTGSTTSSRMTNLYDIIPGVRFIQSKLNQIWSYVPPPPPSSSNDVESTKYKILVVHAHPNPEDSYHAAIVKTFIESATNVGHDIKHISLYDHPFDPMKCYRPNLSRHERDNYFNLLLDTTTATTTETKNFQLAPEVQNHIELLQWCDTLVFIYPTWWMNTPASVKGFIDRTLLPGPTWAFPNTGTTTTTAVPPNDINNNNNGGDDLVGTVRASLLGLIPKLNHIQRIVGISTYGANQTTVFLAGDNGRRMISNAVRHTVCPNASLIWLGLYGVDTASVQQRQDFLKTVANFPCGKFF